MTLFGFLLLILIAAVMIHVNQTKSVQPPEPTKEPEPIPEPQKSHWLTHRTRYIIAIIMTLSLITATLVEFYFFS
jgi:hypothetical protein